MKGGYLIFATSQEKTKNSLQTSHLSHHDLLFIDVRVCVIDLAVVIMNQEGPHQFRALTYRSKCSIKRWTSKLQGIMEPRCILKYLFYSYHNLLHLCNFVASEEVLIKLKNNKTLLTYRTMNINNQRKSGGYYHIIYCLCTKDVIFIPSTWFLFTSKQNIIANYVK